MRAALAAWGADSNLFHQSAAEESEDPELVAATMAKPSVILRRGVGSDGPYTDDAALPTNLPDDEAGRSPQESRPRPKSGRPKKRRQGSPQGRLGV
jgi:colicin import membrane protein